MPTGQAPPTNQETTPQKKSLLTRLKASFEAKVSKSAYDALLSQNQQLQNEKKARHKEYNELLDEATAEKAKKEEINALYEALVKKHKAVKEERDNLKSTIADIEKFLTEVEDVIDG